MENPEKTLTVTEYIGAVNIALNRFKVKITGEVTQVTIATSGHVYFTIKDTEKSVLNCIMWKYNYNISGMKLEEGMEVVLLGVGDIYKPDGKFSFKAESIALKGEGELRKAYLKLKETLQKEGVFEKKKPIPLYPHKIGIITSKSGAAIGDFRANLGKFGFKIQFMHSRVEGMEAVKDILSAIKSFEKRDIDLLVLTRGGGSLESLQAFNNEKIVRKVANLPFPVVVAIGHERDVPLVSLASDATCSTPTAVAEFISSNWEKASLDIMKQEKIIINSFQYVLQKKNKEFSQRFLTMTSYLNKIFNFFHEFEFKLQKNLEQLSQNLKDKNREIKQAKDTILQRFTERFPHIKQQLTFVEKAIKAHDPQKNLSLGYCIIRRQESIVKSVTQVEVNEMVSLQLEDGKLNSKIIEKYGKNKS